MAKTTFSKDNVRSAGPGFPRVKLAKDEVWRIALAEENPTYVWTHRLEKPKFSQNTGEVVMKKITKQNGEEITVHDLDFVGSPVCMGDLDILADKGADPDHCPVCKEAMRSDHFRQPERRFAVHVLKYGTKGNSTVVSSPFMVETKVWVMSENRYAKLVEVIENWGNGPLGVDLKLGPCSNAMFQNYEISGERECEWQANPERMAFAKETFENNNAGDLEPYCGREVKDVRYLNSDIDEIVSLWNRAAGGVIAPAPASMAGTLDNSLLDSVPAAAPAPAAVPSASLSDLDDSVPGGTPAPAAAPAEEKKKDLTFDNLLAGLG